MLDYKQPEVNEIRISAYHPSPHNLVRTQTRPTNGSFPGTHTTNPICQPIDNIGKSDVSICERQTNPPLSRVDILGSCAEIIASE